MRSTISSTVYDHTQWRINWKQIAEDIRGQLSFSQQAQMLGMETSTFRRYLTGSEPSYSRANALLLLHTHMCGKDLTQLRLGDMNKSG